MKKSEVTDAASAIGVVSTGFGMVSQSGAGERKATSARQALPTKPQDLQWDGRVEMGLFKR